MFISEIDPKLLDVIGNSYVNKRPGDKLGLGLGTLDGFAKAPISPFGNYEAEQPSYYDPLRFAKQQVKKTASAESFEIGDNVTHGKFGHGIVVDATPTTVTVIFDDFGTKKLAIGMAPLKKV
jgi:DNA helicase-2/ATP-dependent DNA helicase PcrA